MADLSEIDRAGAIKIAGSNPSSGITDNYMQVDANGSAQVGVYDASGNAITSILNGTHRALDAFDQSNGPVSPGTVAGYSSLIGGIYNSALPTPSSGQQVALQVDANSRLITRLLTSTDVVTANQGTANTLANAWPAKITDTTNGPVAVKAASTAAVAADPSFVVALSPNSPLPSGQTGVIGAVNQGTSPWVTEDKADGTPGSTAPAIALQVGGSDGTDLRALATDSSGNQKTVGNIASLGADSGNPVKIGGVYNSTLPTPSTGQRVDVQSDYRGRIIPAPQSLSYFRPIYTLRVQSVPAATTVLSSSVSATISPTKAGNTIIVAACCNAGTLTITDSASQSYSTATTLAGNGTQTSKIFYFPNTAAGVTSVTISSTSSTDLNLIVTEYRGTLTASPLDKTSTNGQTSVTSWTSNATTTTAQASELLIGSCMGTLHTNDVFAAGTGWTAVATQNNTRGGSNLELFMEDQYSTVIGTYAATGTITGNPSDDLYGSIATFKLVTPNMVTPSNSAVTIKSGAGTLANLALNTIGTGSASVTFYDNTTNSGTVIANVSLTSAVGSLTYGLLFTNGLTMVVNSTTADFTVIYD